MPTHRHARLVPAGEAGGEFDGAEEAVSRLTYVSLFSGICAATAAWKPLGMEPLAFAEIEPFPATLLAHRYPGVPNLGDVSRVDWSPYRGKVDVVVGGSPCQSFSVAGLRKSLEDPRGNLTLEYVRAVHAIRPRYAVWENVPGVLSTNDNAFGCFLGALVGSEEAIMAPRGHRNRRSKWGQKWFAVAHDVPGKRRWRRHEMLIEWTVWSRVGVVAGPLGTACWRILDAQYFGLAQRRERVFVVFSPGNRVDPGEILLEWESMRRDSPPSRAQGKGVTHGVARGVGSGSEWPAEISPPSTRRGLTDQQEAKHKNGIAKKAEDSFPMSDSPSTRKAGGGRIDGESETFVATFQNTGQGWWNDRDTAATLRTPKGADSMEANVVAHSLRADGFDASEDGTGRGTPPVPVANTLKANNGGGGFGSDPNETFIPVAVPLQEVGKRTGVSTDDPRAGIGIGGEGDPMYTLQAGAQHGVAIAFHGTQDPCANYGDTAPTIGCNQGQEACIAFHENQRGEITTNDIAGTLKVAGGKPGQGYPAIAYNLRGREGGAMPEPTDVASVRAASGGSSRTYVGVRRLLPVECEKLQGFEPGYTAIPFRGKPAKDGPRYKALGNSMAVNVMAWLARRIIAAEGGKG